MSATGKTRFLCAAGVCLTGYASLGDARANELRWDYAPSFGAESVRERPRPEISPDGIRIGNFLLFPEIGAGTVWSRIASPLASESDFRHEVFAKLDLRSSLPRHALGVTLEGRGVQFQEEDEIRYLDGAARTTWRLDIDHATSLFGAASVALRHSENVDDELPQGVTRPVGELKTTAEIGLRHRAGRIDAAVGVRYVRFDFEDAQTNQGERIDLGWQNYGVLSPFAELGLRLSPGYRVFADIAGNFQENRGTPEIDRDAVGIAANVGVEFELSPLVRVALKGGFAQQDYRQAGLVDIFEPTWEGRLEWLVTPLVTLSLAHKREVRPTNYGLASGQIAHSYLFNADYELMRNLIVSASAGWRDATYIGESREDTILLGSVALEYMPSKNWLVTVSFEHQELISSAADYDRTLDKVGLSVKYRF
jgi:hypothetical protein